MLLIGANLSTMLCSVSFHDTAHLLPCGFLHNQSAAVWAIPGVSREHRIAVWTAGVMSFVAVKERFPWQLLATGGAEERT